MTEFTAITTQEQFDTAIGERLKRERETLEKKHSEQITVLETKVSEYEKNIGDLTKNLEESNQKYMGYDTTLAELQEKLKGHETNSVKMRIAHESGIPYELAGRLSGETESDIRKDAESFSKYVGNVSTAAPLKSTEPASVDSTRAAFRELASNLTEGD